MYRTTNDHTGSVVARVNKDRVDRPILPPTAKNKQGRKLLTVAEWNIRTLLDREGASRPERRTALVAMELAKYNIDIAALSETRLSSSGSVTDIDYTFFWSGRPENERREAGVGFAVKKEIVSILTEMPRPISDRIMTMRLPLDKNTYATLISVYAPTLTNSDENKEEFYNQLTTTLGKVPRTDKLLLMGDFNARIGSDFSKWHTVIGKHGIGKCNSNGELLLNLCSEFELVITNTMFKQKEQRKTTWMHPRSKHWHLIDFIITRSSDKSDIHSTRVMRGANCWTDHQMLRSKVAFAIRKKHKKQGPSKPIKLNTAKLRLAKERERLKEEMDSKTADLDYGNCPTPEESWDTLQQVVYSTAKTCLGKPDRKHQDWFDPSDQKLRDLLEKRDKAHQKVIQTRSTRSTVAAYTDACRQLQKHTRALKTNWWDKKAEALQEAADRNDMRGFYSGLKEVWGPQKKGPVHLKTSDGRETISDSKRVLSRWAEHFQTLLNVPGDIEPSALDRIQQHPTIESLDDTPTIDEVAKAIDAMKDGKAPGQDGIPAEVWKYGGQNLLVKLHDLIIQIWKEGEVPQAWKDASIVTIFKKGDRTECGNYRGISLLSIASKIFARVLLNRLTTHVTPNVVPESQCGFRSNRSTVDMIFCLRQLQEKCIEQNRALYIVFVDFTKAFDTVGRTGLWKLLRKYGCPDKFTSLVESLHTGMMASVSDGTNSSDSFGVTNGVKQGCVLAPTLFSIFLSAMLEEAFRDLDDGVYIQSRQDADLYNVAHFRAKTKCTLQLIRDLLFADDSALLAHSPEEIQRIIDAFSEASKKFGLKINIKKTEVLYQPDRARTKEVDIKVDGVKLNSVPEFTYLGSTVSNDGRIDVEIQKRMAKASAAFGRLRQRLWNNHHVSTRVKGKIYRAVVISTLLYGAESWTVYRQQVKKLHAFMMRHLRSILKITWMDKVTNEEILDRMGLPSMEDLLIRKNLRWTGHIQLASGSRDRGRPRLRYKDTIKRNLKRRNIRLDSWVYLTSQRAEWRKAVK
jgi:hypothetical protein